MLCMCEKIVLYSVCRSAFDFSLTKVRKSKFDRQIAFCIRSEFCIVRVPRSKYPARQKLVFD